MAKLIVTQAPGQERIVELPTTGAAFTLGREDGCDLAIDDKKLSRRHCAFQQTALGRWTVCDLGSRNGTRRNGTPVAQEPTSLEDGDVVELGNVKVRLRVGAPSTVSSAVELGDEMELETIPMEGDSAGEAPGRDQRGSDDVVEVEIDEPASAPEPAPRRREDSPAPAADLPEGVEFVLIVEPPKGEGAPTTVGLVGERLTIGKNPTCDLVLTDRKVSGVHCEIVQGDGGYHVRDLGSTNGTRVAGSKVKGDGAPLSHGDQVSLGGTRLTFKHRDLPLDDDFLQGAKGVSSVPSGRGRTPWGGLLFSAVLLGLLGGGLWFFLQDKMRPNQQQVRAPRDSLIQSGFSFEETKVGAAPEDYIRLRGAGAAAVSDVSANSGTKALQLIPEGELVVGLREPFAARPGDMWTLRVHAKTMKDATLALHLRAYSRHRSEGDSPPAEAPAGAPAGSDFTHTAGTAPLRATSGAFEELAATFVVPQGANHIGVELVAAGEGQVFLDDVTLSRASISSSGATSARIDGNFMGVLMDSRGVFLADRLKEPLVQDGEIRVREPHPTRGVQTLGPANLAAGIAPVVNGVNSSWKGTYVTEPGGGDGGLAGTELVVSAECQVIASGFKMVIRRGNEDPEPAEVVPGEEAPVAPDESSPPAQVGGLEVVFATTLDRVAGLIGVIGGTTRDKLPGEFEELDEIFQLIFDIDNPAQRCALSIEPPARVRLARIDGRPTFRIRADDTSQLVLTWESSFRTDPARLDSLLAEANELERTRHYGEAMQRYRQVLQEFPFNEVKKAQAEVRLTNLTKKGEARTKSLIEQVDSTQRMGHRNFKEAARRDILRMEADYAGTAFLDELVPLREALEQEMAAEDSAERESIAARLFHSGQDFVASGYRHVGCAKLEYCVDEYGRSPDDPGFAWAAKSKALLESLKGEAE